MKKQHSNINIVYSGSDVEDGIIDVKSLARSLLSFANLVQRVSELTTEDKAIIDIKIKALSKGSFDVSLVMEALLSWDNIKSLFSSEDYNAVIEILTVLGFSVTGGIGLFRLYKYLKNKKYKSIKDNGDDNFIITSYDNKECVVPKKVLIVYQDMEVRNAIKEVIKDTLNREGLDSISFKSGDIEEVISKEEANYFDIQISEDNEEEEIIEKEYIGV